jgi:hypothetical protein
MSSRMRLEVGSLRLHSHILHVTEALYIELEFETSQMTTQFDTAI